MDHGNNVQNYLTDIGVFKGEAFIKHVNEHQQQLRFCGAKAQHQNGVAEFAIQTVSNIARAMLLHASTHWTNNVKSDLWSMAILYAAYNYNHTPKKHVCTAGVFFVSVVPRHHLKDLHVLSCPVFQGVTMKL